MTDFYRPINRVRVMKVRDVERERAIRLYCEQFQSAYGLQIRAPLGVGSMGSRDGKDFVVAHAHLGWDDLLALRDAIQGALDA